MPFRISLLAALALTFALAPAAQAQDHSVTGVGTAFIAPQPADRDDNASILAAVREAQRAVVPMAIEAARVRATQLADAAGLQLGALRSVADVSHPYGPFGGGGVELGTFGPGRFCGTVARFRTRRTASGRIRRVRTGSRRICRIPRIYSTLAVTYAATPR